MSEGKKGERKSRRIAYTLALLVPFVSILIAEMIGWNPLSVYLAANGIEYGCLALLGILIAVLVLPALWADIRIRFF